MSQTEVAVADFETVKASLTDLFHLILATSEDRGASLSSRRFREDIERIVQRNLRQEDDDDAANDLRVYLLERMTADPGISAPFDDLLHSMVSSIFELGLLDLKRIISDLTRERQRELDNR